MNFAQLGSTRNRIQVTMFLHPIIYINSEVLGSDTTDVSPKNMYKNFPLPGDGEELEPPIKDEWGSFIRDCKFIIKEAGFTIKKSEPSNEFDESECIITYGKENKLGGTIACNLRISEHPFDAAFPEAYKVKVKEYFKGKNILDGTARKAGIDFQVEKVIVDGVETDSWCNAISQLYTLMKDKKNERGD